jgi:hypothetical protein
MSEKLYSIQYDTTSAVKAAKNVDAFAASIVKHDAAVVADTAATKKQTAAYNELATAAGRAAKMVDTLAASMAAATAQGNAFATTAVGAAVGALDLDKAAKAAGTSARQFGKSLDTAGTAAKAAAHGIDQATAAARAANIPIGSAATATRAGASAFRAFGKAATTAATNVGTVATATNTATAALNGTATAGAAAKAGLASVGKAAAGAVPGTKGLAAGLQRLISTAAALGILRKVIGEIGDAMKDAREFDTSTADSNFEKRKEARELAFNMGEKGVTEKVMGRVFGTALSSGMTFKEALAHNQEFEGSVVAGKLKGNVRDDQKEAISKATAVVARRSGLDAKTAGDMTGVILHHMNVNTDANGKPISADVAAQMVASKLDSMVTGLAAGRGSVSTLSKGEISQAASAVGSGHATLDEMTGLISTASNYSKNASGVGTKYSQISDIINRPDAATADLLKESGVADAKGDVAKLQAMKKHLDEKRAEAEAKGEKFDEHAYLYDKGFHLKAARESLVSMLQFVGSKDKPNVLEKQIAEAQANSRDFAGTKSRNAEFMAMPDSRMAVAKAAREAAEYKHGKKTEDLQAAREAAAARLISDGTFKDKTQLVADAARGGFGLQEFMGLPSQIQQRIDEEALNSAMTAAENAGVPVNVSPGAFHMTEDQAPVDITKADPRWSDPELPRRHGIEYLLKHPEETARVFKDLSARGVDVYGGTGSLSVEQQIADRDPEKAKAWEAAKQARPNAPVKQPVDYLHATPREPATPLLPVTPDGKHFGVVSNGLGNSGGNMAASVDTTKLDRSADKLGTAADKLLSAMQQANMPGMPSNFGNFGGYRA